jgi:carboxypeptidase Q
MNVLFRAGERPGEILMIRVAATTVVATLLLVPVAAEETVDREVGWRIRREAIERSHIMRTLHVLTDLHGPRLTGSPNHEAAARWVVQQLTEWGLKDARLEPWDFGRPGWLNERFSAHVVSPVKDSLVGEVLAWTPSTDGTVTAPAIQLVPPDRPTHADLAAWLASVQEQVADRIVLVGRAQEVGVSLNAVPKRREDADLRAQFDPVSPAPSPFAAMLNQPPADPTRLTAFQIAEQIDAMLVAGGAVARVNDAGRDHGQIRAFQNRTYDVGKAVPTVVLRNEDYGRLTRLMAGGHGVELELTIVNRLYPEGRTSYNVLAEIPGTDKADEVVMLGGHLDSWHAATGATDNAIGCAVMMEAVRILRALGVGPRRTIRLALWGGEEQGLLGSQAYVKEHFGTFEQPKPAYDTLVAYFNIDSGTGRARGMSIFGPPDAAAVLRAALAPFEDLGVLGAVASSSRRRGGTDHTSFNEAGLTGVGVAQDPIEYGSHTWHTNLDTYERIIPEDAVKSATAIAAVVYHVAMRDERLPRFTKEQMPAPPVPRPGDPPAAPPTPTAAAAEVR